MGVRTKDFLKFIGAVAAAVVLGVGMMWGCGENDNPKGDGFNPFNPNINYGEFTDSRDGKKYKSVVIGGQTWMAENLKFEAPTSWCYDISPDSCAKYGRLYDWNTAMAGASGSNDNPSGVRGLCPDGWHLPSNDEWTQMTTFVGSSNTGTTLKSSTGWQPHLTSPVGTDAYGFSALPGGYRNTNGVSIEAGFTGYWWETTDYNVNRAYSRSIRYDGQSVSRPLSNNKVGIGYSVRCLKD